MKLDNWLAQRSQSCPERTALVADGAEVTYSELEAESVWVARRLGAHGVRRGATAALTMSPSREQVVLIHALMKLGAVVLPISPALSAPERRAVLEAESPAVDLDDAGHLTQTEADLPLLGEHDMDDIHCRILTSGSTGAPHTVGLTYGNHLWSAVGSAFNIGVEPDDRWLCCLPLGHIAGLSIVMRSVIYGTTAVLHDGFDVDRVAASLREDGVTVVSLVSTMLVRLLDAGADLSGPRAILVGGGPVPAEVLEEALGRGRDRRPDLWADRVLLPGDDAGPGRGEAQGRLRRPAAAHHPSADQRRRDPRSRGRPWRPAAPMPTAGCTPATSAASTTRASYT